MRDDEHSQQCRVAADASNIEMNPSIEPSRSQSPICTTVHVSFDRLETRKWSSCGVGCHMCVGTALPPLHLHVSGSQLSP